MRSPMLLLIVALAALGAWSTEYTDANDFGGQTVLAASLQADQPAKDLNIDIDINRGGNAQWYGNPMWIAIGGLAVIALVLLVVLASRGGGTTIVKE